MSYELGQEFPYPVVRAFVTRREMQGVADTLTVDLGVRVTKYQGTISCLPLVDPACLSMRPPACNDRINVDYRAEPSVWQMGRGGG